MTLSLTDAESIGHLMQILHRLDQHGRLLDEQDERGSNHIGYLGSELHGVSAKSAQKIRTIIREDIAADREGILKDLDRLGVART